MFARMPRYGPAQPGIRSAARMRATGQNGSSRHVLTLHDSSSRRINEQSSGLLIRGFGVQVPGGAPVLTWGCTAPGYFYVPGLSWCLGGARSVLARRSDVGGLGRLVQFGQIGLDQPNGAFRWRLYSAIAAASSSAAKLSPGYRLSWRMELGPSGLVKWTVTVSPSPSTVVTTSERRGKPFAGLAPMPFSTLCRSNIELRSLSWCYAAQ